MDTKKEEKTIANIAQAQSDGIELKSVKKVAENGASDNEPGYVSIDLPDKSCAGCQIQSTEDVSMSSDDYTEQAISLTMNKKYNSIAYKGMMDIALLTANANQLRFLISYNSEEKTFYISATFIVLSLVIQVAVGIGMIFKRQMKKKGNTGKADKIGSLVISGIFCLAVLNVLVISFTATTPITNNNKSN